MKLNTLAAGCLMITTQNFAAPRTITVHIDQPTVELKESLYGLFYEDINYSADGGLYAELLQNRSFEYYALDDRIEKQWDPKKLTPLTGWETVEKEGGSCALSIADAAPLNTNNTHYACLKIQQSGAGVGLANTGYDGIYVEQGKYYDFSVFAKRSESVDEPLKITLRDADGSVIAETTIPAVSNDWKKQEAELVASETTDKARLEITTRGTGEICFDMVSLFPRDTFKGRKNGLRKDLAQALVDLNPKVLRFPGGCIVHGQGLDNAYRWKETIGPVEARKPNWNLWGYHQSMGLGYFEYFQLAEDLGAEPLPIVPAGVSCGFRGPEFEELDHLQTWIDDAIDLIEFANGPVDSTWGKVRAEMGHPEPFNLKYLGLGNEEHDTPEFRERFPIVVKAFREAHPEILIVGTSGFNHNIPLYDLMCEQDCALADEHYYCNPDFFIGQQNRFDEWDRSKTPIFVGEYASNANAHYNAVAEAVFLTGVERNGDIVHMTAYAPLFARYGFTQWKRANMIWFNHNTVVKTPNYYVQQLFATNKGDVYLKNSAEGFPYDIGISATLDNAANEVILKIANPLESAYAATVNLEGSDGLAQTGMLTVLAGQKDATNTLEHPDTIQPETSQIPTGKSFTLQIPAMSVQFLRIAR